MNVGACPFSANPLARSWYSRALKKGSMIAAKYGQYQEQQQIGHGAMGVVYRAVDLQLGRTVAIKVLSRQYLSDETFRARFAHEARVAARLEHSAIVPLYGLSSNGASIRRPQSA